MTDVAEALRGERGLVLVLTGAGVSLASGLPTFRGTDPDAIWTKDVTEMGTRRYFQRDPVGSWLWYGKRFASLAGAQPNPAHHPDDARPLPIVRGVTNTGARKCATP